MSNGLVFWLRRESDELGDIANRTITIDKLIEELKLAKDTIGGDTKIFIGDESNFIGDENNNVYGGITLMRITREEYEAYED